MKKIYLSLLAPFVFIQFSNAQNSTFPTDGTNVGIGTMAPASSLTVKQSSDPSLGNDGNGAIRIYNSAGSSFGQLQVNSSGIELSSSGTTLLPLYLNTQRAAVPPLTIAVNGNVGIRTTSPSFPLSVQGTIEGRGVAWFTQPSPVNSLAVDATNTALHRIYTNTPTADLSIGTDFSDDQIYMKGNGNVGIGTQNPLSNFQVDDGCTKASIGDASGQALNFGTSYLGFNASRSGSSWTTSSDGRNNTGGGVIYGTIFGDMYFATIPTVSGTSGQLLADNDIKSHIQLRIGADGTTHAKKIMVELTNWPDYVFQPKYILRPLSEVKTYIDQNHHLPEMPSEKEIKDKGLDVGEMNKLLTKKVEELTLYLIEKDKKEKEQDEKLNIQNKKLLVQEEKLNKIIEQMKALTVDKKVE